MAHPMYIIVYHIMYIIAYYHILLCTNAMYIIVYIHGAPAAVEDGGGEDADVAVEVEEAGPVPVALACRRRA